MTPTKAKVRKTKEVAAPTPQAKGTNRTGNKELAPAIAVQGQYQINDEEVAVQADLAQKLDALVKAVTDLSR